ncbi:phage tail protein [Dyadobacter sp. CY261]|uniref:phage tail protein n=1 Tax=Dyadobacter sp. CY261 TaxID=2907203 RepID=UPI001F1D477B|nr:phage tail protein [Dyadobacter sp. CY261]MCF0074338.1 phage tail protein [Dyadobacter sp. CY261]
MSFYPPIGFLFKVSIKGVDDAEADFQEVSGLSMTLETLALKEGGQNRFVHQLPVRTTSDKLVLKRGLKLSSGLTKWCREAIEEFSFSPKTMTISLLDPGIEDALSTPLVTWEVTHAYPVKWSLSSFNAMNNDLAIETVEIQYRFFTKVFPE